MTELKFRKHGGEDVGSVGLYTRADVPDTIFIPSDSYPANVRKFTKEGVPIKIVKQALATHIEEHIPRSLAHEAEHLATQKVAREMGVTTPQALQFAMQATHHGAFESRLNAPALRRAARMATKASQGNIFFEY